MSDNQVLIISFWNPTAKSPQKGIFIEEQAAAICSLRDNIIFLQVNVLTSNRLLLKKTIEESTFYNNKRIVINLYTRLWKFLYVDPWRLSRIIYRIIKNRDYKISPAIIHSNVIFPCGIAGYLLARKMGAKTIISEHWSKSGKLLKHPLYKRIAIRAYRKCFAVICVSEFLSHKISRATGDVNMIVIPNIINTELFTYQPKPSPDNGNLCFMCVASWRPPKRLDLIIDALCKYASETSRQINLRVVGTGAQVEMMKCLEIPENLHIDWTGYLGKPAIAELLHTTHIFLHASDIETFSIVAAEALSTGTPVLASNAGALPELINDCNGMLADNNPGAWLNGVRIISSKKYDYESIADQQKNKYSSIEIGNKILSVYNKASSSAS
ncbi:MAG: glycosyltransferase [Bacteroidales bacterium]|nr:glycosyltransferase [Bacteroidales bacterium]